MIVQLRYFSRWDHLLSFSIIVLLFFLSFFPFFLQNEHKGDTKIGGGDSGGGGFKERGRTPLYIFWCKRV